MKIKKKYDYAIVCIIFLLGIIIGYSPNFSKTKTFNRIHAPIGIELRLRLSFLENAIHYELSINDFDKKKIEKYKFPYTNRIPIGIIRDTLTAQHSVTLLLQDKSQIAVLYKKDIPINFFLAHYCGCSIFMRGRIEETEVSNLKGLWKNTNQFMIPSSFLSDRSIMFTKKISF